jgi:rhamnosyltransferase
MFKDRIEIKILNIEKYTPGKAINLGVKNCKHKNILVLSGHSQIKLLNSDSVIKGLEKYPAIFGKQIPIYKGKKITPRYIWSHFKDEKIIENMFSEIEQRYFLHNAFCFYNRQFLINNPFDENLSGKEDRYWAANIVKKGFKYLYDSKNLICNHYYTTNGATWKGLG